MAFKLDKFIEQYPRLYHFTPKSNRTNLEACKKLRTAASLLEEDGQSGLLAKTRTNAVPIKKGAVTINDQQPLANCSDPAFVRCLSDIIFFWKGDKHGPSSKAKAFMKKYNAKGYGCLQLHTDVVFGDKSNPPYFCIVNSGAPHPLDAFGGKRHPDIFWPSSEPLLEWANVREVVFRQELSLPKTTMWKDADGDWEPLFPEKGDVPHGHKV